MTRPLRIEFPGALYVVTARALPRQRLFREPSEVEDFVARLPALGEGFGAVFHGFSIVPTTTTCSSRRRAATSPGSSTG